MPRRLSITIITIWALSATAQDFKGAAWSNEFADPFRLETSVQTVQPQIITRPQFQKKKPKKIIQRKRKLVSPKSPTKKARKKSPTVQRKKYGIDMVRGNFCSGELTLAPSCKLVMSKPLWQAMNDHLQICVQRAAKSSGMGSARKIKVHHWGLFSDRNARGTSSKSLHASGRALDISKISFVSNGKKISLPMNKKIRGNDSKMNFYQNFRSCWKQRAQPKGCQNSIGFNGSGRPSNGLHHDHIHLSYTCPKLNGHASI